MLNIYHNRPATTFLTWAASMRKMILIHIYFYSNNFSTGIGPGGRLIIVNRKINWWSFGIF